MFRVHEKYTYTRCWEYQGSPLVIKADSFKFKNKENKSYNLKPEA